ncbi:hypothetical protein BDR07DRAFT_1484350 [Suillus spraguei]|nr:hypothetical protein BDR07DRAFT_1484350 [Suillus spraguei]
MLSESDTIGLVRATAPTREQVNCGLLDMFLESCLSARCYAHTHEEGLFEASKVSWSFLRSSSGLTMADAMSMAAKNCLTKWERVLVPRQKSYIDVGDIPAVPTISPVKLVKCHQPMKLKLVAISTIASLDDEVCSSVSVSTPGSLAASLIVPESPSAPTWVLSGSLHIQAKPFYGRECPNPLLALYIANASLSYSPSDSGSVSTAPSLLKWWSKGTLLRRVQSAPDVPLPQMHQPSLSVIQFQAFTLL